MAKHAVAFLLVYLLFGYTGRTLLEHENVNKWFPKRKQSGWGHKVGISLGHVESLYFWSLISMLCYYKERKKKKALMKSLKIILVDLTEPSGSCLLRWESWCMRWWSMLSHKEKFCSRFHTPCSHTDLEVVGYSWVLGICGLPGINGTKMEVFAA